MQSESRARPAQARPTEGPRATGYRPEAGGPAVA